METRLVAPSSSHRVRSGMSTSDQRDPTLRKRLEGLLAEGLSEDPKEHAGQVAKVAGILSDAFGAHGLVVTLVGGSAIEIHAPGIYRSGDIDVVIERTGDATAGRDDVFQSLGLERIGKHWRHGDLFIETVPGPVAGPTEEVELHGTAFRVVRKEALLRDRVVGFKHWRHTAYGDQAIAMLVAFEGDLDLDWIESELEREDALDAFARLKELARSQVPVTHTQLLEVLEHLRRRES